MFCLIHLSLHTRWFFKYISVDKSTSHEYEINGGICGFSVFHFFFLAAKPIKLAAKILQRLLANLKFLFYGALVVICSVEVAKNPVDYTEREQRRNFVLLKRRCNQCSNVLQVERIEVSMRNLK
jgi:hypothetical protein